MCWDYDQYDHVGIRVQYLGCGGGQSIGRLSEWQYRGNSDDGGGVGYEARA